MARARDQSWQLAHGTRTDYLDCFGPGLRRGRRTVGAPAAADRPPPADVGGVSRLATPTGARSSSGPTAARCRPPAAASGLAGPRSTAARRARSSPAVAARPVRAPERSRPTAASSRASALTTGRVRRPLALALAARSDGSAQPGRPRPGPRSAGRQLGRHRPRRLDGRPAAGPGLDGTGRVVAVVTDRGRTHPWRFPCDPAPGGRRATRDASRTATSWRTRWPCAGGRRTAPRDRRQPAAGAVPRGGGTARPRRSPRGLGWLDGVAGR